MRISLTVLLHVVAIVLPVTPAIAGEDSSRTTAPDNATVSHVRVHPDWFSLHGQFRGRLEGPAGNAFEPGNNDVDFLSRLRLDLAIKPLSWMRIHVQGQDSRAAGYDNRTASVQGAYLRQSTKGSGYTYPYLMLTRTL